MILEASYTRMSLLEWPNGTIESKLMNGQTRGVFGVFPSFALDVPFKIPIQSFYLDSAIRKGLWTGKAIESKTRLPEDG